MKRLTTLAIVAALFTLSGYSAENNSNENEKQSKPAIARQYGPGPVVSISENYNSLPTQIKDFLTKYFPNVASKEIEMKPMKGIYEVDLTNGYDLQFLTSGQWVKVDAPNKTVIPETMLKDLLPKDSYAFLKKKKLTKKIKEITHNPDKGFKVEAQRDKEYYFDLEGNKVDRRDDR